MIKKKTFSSKLFSSWKKLGPGLVTGASDDDPSGIATYPATVRIPPSFG